MDNSRHDSEYFKNYYKDNKKRYKQRYEINKQKKLDEYYNALPDDYYFEKLKEWGLTITKLNLKTYEEVFKKESYCFS